MSFTHQPAILPRQEQDDCGRGQRAELVPPGAGPAAAGAPAGAADAGEADEAQAQLAEPGDAHGNKMIGMQEWLAARRPIEARLSVARKQLANATRTTVLNGNVGAPRGA